MSATGTEGERSTFSWLARIGADPSDTPEVALQKRSLVLFTVISTVMSSVWVLSYWAMGLMLSAAIPLVYQVITVINLGLFARTRQYRFFRSCEHFISLIFPFALQLSLGGFVSSSGVVLWSFTTPVGAMLFSGRRAAMHWFIAFLGIVALAGILDPLLPNTTGHIPYWVNIAFFCLNVFGVTVTCFLPMQYFVLERDRATGELAEERERSENLLRNVLPAPIAERLKAGGSVIADGADDVGVLFADIVGFTPLSATMAPGETVNLLNEVFSAFDSLTEKHGLEKIKTIGDAYMVASGLPGSRPTHAEDLAAMALDMLEVVRGHPPLELRIGIDIGPVVAGVIGRRKFIYDLWGDTVNTASRMESHGVTGGIQVTERVFERLKDRFVFTPRGSMEIKGKGVMSTYLLTGREALRTAE